MLTPSVVVIVSAVLPGWSGSFSFLATNMPTALILPWPVAGLPFTLNVAATPFSVVATMALVPRPPSLSTSVMRYQPSSSEPMAAVPPLPATVLSATTPSPTANEAANVRNQAASLSPVLVAATAAGLLSYSEGMLTTGSMLLLAAATASVTAVTQSASVSTCTASPSTVSEANLYAE